MKNIWKTYKKTIILLLGIIIGAIIGVIFKERAEVLKPFGDIFVNMMFVIIVPLVFLTITTSISKMDSNKRLGKVFGSIVGIFAVTSIIALLVGYFSIFKINLVEKGDTNAITAMFVSEEVATEDYTILERTADVLTVGDFSELLSKNHLIALIVVAVILGIAIRQSKEKGEKLKEVLESANNVLMKFIDIIMLYAPFGLGCYFAALVGTFGAEIAVGFLKTFIIYLVIAILYYIIVYSLYAFIAGGKKGLVAYWKNVIPATVTSLATCSSAACIPVNTECSKNIGVSNDIAETIIPLGTSFHKDGSIIGSVFKIMFLVCLFGTNITMPMFFKILGVAFVANLLISAVPIGGGTISEMMILTLMKYPLAALPVLTIIATIIDPPATMLNVVGDSASSMLVARIVDGKNWMEQKKKTKKNKRVK